ncbi:MAG: hypothetical protein E6I23_00825 [Chloroflexi bacterium]|nr:MAG: hypothetical protein E6I23_00825 [Chloroflexota bacterium]
MPETTSSFIPSGAPTRSTSSRATARRSRAGSTSAAPLSAPPTFRRAFPERTNVQLFEVIDRSRVRIEIWERGAGYTLASGTSASAVAAACMRAGLVDDQVRVQMPGGNLEVRREKSGNLVQSGPARRVFRANIDIDDFR